MQNHTDGGQAFPSMGNIFEDTRTGMSLRDYFAAKALGMFDSATLKAVHEEARAKDVDPTIIVAAFAYDMADAMLTARAAQSPADTQRAHLDEFGK